MDIVYDCCAGFDVHQATVVVALRDARDGKRSHKETRTYKTTTGELEKMRDWLVGAGVTAIAMESTGVYWRPIFNVVEESFDTVLLCNARHLKRVPGRKTDVSDAEWIAQLLQAGLLNGSFVPDRAMRELRDLNRERTQLTHEQGRVVNRLHKVLQDANLKLATYVTDIMGVSGREMLAAICAGDYDVDATAALAKARMRRKIPELKEALHGHVTDHHRWMIQQYLARYDALQVEIDAFDRRIAALMSSGPNAGPADPPASSGDGPLDLSDESTPSKPEPPGSLSYSAALALIDGIHGISRRGAERLLAEIGTDMSRFPTASHLASWAGVAPGTSTSAGKNKSSKVRKGNAWLREALNQCAWAASRTKDSYFAAAFRRWSARRGVKRAIVAVGHALLRTIYAVLKRQVPFKDLGANWFDDLQPQRTLRSLKKRLAKLGYEAVPIVPAAAT